MEAIRSYWDNLNAQTPALVSGLDERDFEEVITYKSWYGWQGTGPRWEILLHQAFHQHQHRGEVAMMLTRLGHSPGELDILRYLEEQCAGSTVN